MSNALRYIRSIKQQVHLALILFAVLISNTASALDRVKIDSNNNLVSTFNTPLRGAPFFLDRFGIASDVYQGMESKLSTYENYFNGVVTDYKLNMVRCAPWVGTHDYFTGGANQSDHRKHFDTLISNCVQWAENNGIYAIINYHTKFNTELQLDQVKLFWDVYAPQYKNKSHVIFELVNEPEVESAKQHMQAIYDHVRDMAPNTHLILWSFYNPALATANDIKNATPNIDYANDNVSVGWHNYWDVGNTTAWDRADSFADAGLPVINTEFWSLSNQNDFPISYGNIADNVRMAESRGRSWTLWGPYFNYEDASKGVTNSDNGFSSTFIDAVKNGARTIANEYFIHDQYAAGLDGQYWTDKWSPSVGSDGGNGIGNDSISYSNYPTNIDLSGNVTVTASYSAAASRDLVFEFFNQDTGAWLGQAKKTVSAGTGTSSLTVSVGNLVAGNYQLKLGIRDVGAQWQDSIQDVFKSNIVASGNGNGSGGSNATISFNASFADAKHTQVVAYNGWGVGSFGPGRWIKFSQVDLKDGYSDIRMKIGTNGSGAIEVRANGVAGNLLTTVYFSGSNYSNLVWQSASFPAWEHPQDLYFVMKSGWANVGDIEIIDD